MPAAELTRFAKYCRAMAHTVSATIVMAREDLAAARAAARQGNTGHPLTPTQALAVKCGLEREHHLWLQLAGEIDDYLGRSTEVVPETEGLVDLFTPQERS